MMVSDQKYGAACLLVGGVIDLVASLDGPARSQCDVQDEQHLEQLLLQVGLAICRLDRAGHAAAACGSDSRNAATSFVRVTCSATDSCAATRKPCSSRVSVACDARD
eukprot:2227351-Rhodomonas_salina.3